VRVVLAELGSLAVEFTRLAQITKEPKYYDAIARITDALEEWQNHTRLPGMWPTYVDASGCERQMYKSPSLNVQSDGASTLTKLDWKGNPIETIPTKEQEFSKPPPIAFSSNKGPTPPLEPNAASNGKPNRIKGWDENHPEQEDAAGETKLVPVEKPEPLLFESKPANKAPKVKRQFDAPNVLKELKESALTVPEANIPPAHASPDLIPTTALPECHPHGLGSQSQWGNEEFTLGSLSDSTYEYFPKARTFP
jgi:mannosyl-oligosaccharide alpha-1,2-mannosidase